MADETDGMSKGKAIELDLAKYGEMKIESGGSKPVFERITHMVVIEATIKTDETPKESKGKDGTTQKYYPVFLAVTYEHPDTKTGEPRQSYENYGGGRLYISQSKGGIERLWVGPDSALGALVKVLQDNFDFNGTLKELPKLLRGCKVGVKTEVVTVSGEEYQKNIIKAVYR
jgi:hypothetical protein